jgi:hypothetical protein
MYLDAAARARVAGVERHRQVEAHLLKLLLAHFVCRNLRTHVWLVNASASPRRVARQCVSITEACVCLYFAMLGTQCANTLGLMCRFIPFRVQTQHISIDICLKDV